jgi:Tfp pilus assembly protein PilE
MKKEIIKKKNEGVAVLFAVLISVLLVSIGATIVSISLRQTVLSSTGRESQAAFYAANTALECALYWDINSPTADQYVFPLDTGDPDTSLDQLSDYSGVTCAGSNINLTEISANTYEFYLIITNIVEGGDNKYCAKVLVEKSFNSPNQVNTRIETRGYNVPDCNSSSPRIVERGLELFYTS